eukprot:jgi/Chlat1/5460/Chrsp36S05423
MVGRGLELSCLYGAGQRKLCNATWKAQDITAAAAATTAAAMELELKARAEKLAREQRRRQDAIRRKVEQEKREREAAARRREAEDVARQEERVAAFTRQQEEEQRQADLLRLTEGILYAATLRLVPSSTAGMPLTCYAQAGDKVSLPPSALDSLSQQDALDKGPMYLRVTDAGTGASTHAGVLDFTAEEGQVAVPHKVLRSLALTNEQELDARELRVQYVRLSKGKYAQLQADSAEFADVPSQRGFLEGVLRTHATLTEGDVLHVVHAGSQHALRVMKLQPEPQVSLIDTELEVDIVALKDEKGKRTRLEVDKPESDTVEENMFQYYEFELGQPAADDIAAGSCEYRVQLELSNPAEADADLYLARKPISRPSQHQHEWASHDVGNKTICLSSLSSPTPTPGLYAVGVYGYRGNAKYTLVVNQLTKTSPGRVLSQEASVTQGAADDYATCSNCGQAVPARSMALHEAFCARHNVRCMHPGCSAVLRRADAAQHVHCKSCGRGMTCDALEKHMRIEHARLACACGAQLEMSAMAHHRGTECPLRLTSCRFCEAMVPAGSGQATDPRDALQGLTVHESECGSRTLPCAKCKKSVRLKDMVMHMAAVHGPRASPLPTSEPLASAPQPMDADVPSTSASCCPVCNMEFHGMDAHVNLNAHLDEHFNAAQPPAINLPTPTASAIRLTCPICGDSLASERQLGVHIDEVH